MTPSSFVARRSAMRRAVPIADIPRQAILDAVPAHLALVNATGQILEVNERWRSFAWANGLPDSLRAACVGANYLTICDRALPPGPEVSAGIRAVLSGMQPAFTFLYSCHSPTEKRWFSLQVTPVAMGNDFGAMTAHWNVTSLLERDQVRSELLAIVESSNDAIISKDLEGIITSWNAGAERTFGIPAAAMIGQSINRMVPADRMAEEGAILATIEAGNVVLPFETIRLRTTGEPFEVIVSVSPIRDADGVVVGAATVLRDVSSRIAAERGLARMNRALRLMGRCHAALIHSVDSPTLLTRVCEAAVDIGEYRFAWVGAVEADERRSIRPIASAGHDDGYLAEMQLSWDATDPWGRGPAGRAIRSGAPVICNDIDDEPADSPWTAAARIRGFRGIACLPLRRAGVTFAVLSLYSVVSRHISDDEVALLTELADELAFGITSLEAQQERRRLEAEQRQQSEMVYRAQRMESLGTLAGGIAHDLNNALAPIMLSVDLLRDDVPAGSRDLLDTVAASARRAAHMVSQVLAFSRVENGDRVAVAMVPLIGELCSVVADTFPKNIEVRVAIGEDLRWVTGDPTQLRQVLLNVCVNSRDAMLGGGILRLSVANMDVDTSYTTMHPEASVGSYVEVSIEDTGVGMRQEILDRIFDPFFTTKEPGKGTGLGLSTSLAIVRSQGGFIRVVSRPSVGTTVHVHLRAAADDATDAGDATEVPLARGNGELVLVIDDEAAIRLVTSQTLEAFGYRVLAAADGAEGIAAYAEHRSEIAVVLTDMMMPVMDGPTTIRVLRRIDPGVRIVSVSGVVAGDRSLDEVRARRHLTKPYTAGTLLTTLRDVLGEP